MRKVIVSSLIILILIVGMFALTGCEKVDESEKITEGQINAGFKSKFKVSSSSNIEKYPLTIVNKKSPSSVSGG